MQRTAKPRSKYLDRAYIARKLGNLRWVPIRHWFDLRQIMQLRVTYRDPDDGERYRFLADSLHSYQRARGVLSKEPKTIEWIRNNLRPDDVFLDIGANIGTFSLYVARHMTAAGHVYACEPHLPTAVQLMQNVAANDLDERISVITVAVSDQDGLVPFRYKRWRQGASGSQLLVDGGPGLEAYVATELKSAMRIDTMVDKGLIRAPDLVKIDTDGIELQIVAGMKNLLLNSDRRPRSILVEAQPGELELQTEQMRGFGYRQVSKHLNGNWNEMRRRGVPDEALGFNAIFAPKT